MKIKYKNIVYTVVKETPKMFYISDSKRVRKESCEIINDATPKTKKTSMAKRALNSKTLKIDQNVVVYQDDVLVGEGRITTIFRENNSAKITPGIYLNNDVNTKFVFADVKIYKA